MSNEDVWVDIPDPETDQWVDIPDPEPTQAQWVDVPDPPENSSQLVDIQDSPEDNPPGWFSSLGNSAARGIGNISEGIAGAIKWGEENLGTGTNIGDKLLEHEKPYQAYRNELLKQVNPDSAQGYANAITEGLTQYVPSLASGYGLLGMAGQMGLTSFGKDYADKTAAGIDPAKAEQSAAIKGLSNAALAVPIFQSAQAAGPILRRMLFGGGVGAVSSAANTLTGLYGDSIATGEPVKPYEAKDALRRSVITGGLTGAALPAVNRGMEAISNPEPNVDYVGQVLRERLAARPIEQPATQDIPAPIEPKVLPDVEAPALAPEPVIPEKLVVQESKPLVVSNESATMPKTIEQAEATTKVVDQPLPKDRPEPPPVDPGSSWQKLSELAKPLTSRITNSDVNQLSPDQAWFEGLVAGGRKVPGLSSALSALRGSSLPKTIADRFPEVSDFYYKGGRTAVEAEKIIASDLSDTLRPYFEADNPKLVDAYIGQAGELTKEMSRAGQSTPKFEDADLQALGMTEKDIAAVKAHREGMNQSLETLRQTLVSQGRKVKGAENRAQYEADVNQWIDSMKDTNYFPARRYGEAFEVIAKGKNGGQPYREHFDSLEAARSVRSAIAKSGEYTDIQLNQRPQLDLEAFGDLPSNLASQMTGFNPEKWTAMAQQQPMRGFTRHLVEKQAVKGYEKDIRKSTIDYVLGLSKYAAREKAMVVLDQVENSLPEGSALRGYVKRYASERLFKAEGGVTKLLLKFNNLVNLAAVPSSALVNTTQTINMTLPKMEGELIKHFGFVGAAKETPLVFGRGIKNTFTYLAGKSGLKGARSLDPELFHHNELASKSGVVDAEGIQDLYNMKAKIQGNPSLADTMMFMFSAAEKANRFIAFNGFREVGKAKGLEGDSLYDYAKNMTEATQFDQTVANRSPAFARGPMRLASQYRTFQVNNLRFLRDNFNAKDYPTVALSLAATMGLGGALALPFARDTEKIAQANGISVKGSVRKFLQDEKWADRVLYGLPTDAGINLSGAVSTGEFVPSLDTTNASNMLKMLGPTADYFGNRVPKALQTLSKDDNPLVAAEILAPRALRNPLKALRSGAANEIQDAKGKPLVKNPTAKELAGLSIGLTPQRLAIANEFNGELYGLKARANSSPRDYTSLMAQAVKLKDVTRMRQLVDEIKTLNESRPPEAQIQLNLDRVMEEAKSSDKPELEEFKRIPKKARGAYVELLNRYGKIPKAK